MADLTRDRTPDAVRIALGLSVTTILLAAILTAASLYWNEHVLLTICVALSYWWLFIATCLRKDSVTAWRAGVLTLVLLSAAANVTASLLTCAWLYCDPWYWPVRNIGSLAIGLGGVGSLFSWLTWRFWGLRPGRHGPACAINDALHVD